MLFFQLNSHQSTVMLYISQVYLVQQFLLACLQTGDAHIMSELQPYQHLASLPLYPGKSDQVRVEWYKWIVYISLLISLTLHTLLHGTFNLDTIVDCWAHLINDGVVVRGNSAAVEWQGTGPSADNRVQNFECSLNGGTGISCKSALPLM